MTARACVYVLALGMLPLASTSAKAGMDAETIDDVQCVITAAKLSTSTDPTRRAAAGMLMMLFVGRLEGRSPSLDLDALVKREIPNLTDSVFKTSVQRCTSVLAAVGQQMARIGSELTQASK